MTKKILFFLLAALCLASCNKNETTVSQLPVEEKDVEVSIVDEYEVTSEEFLASTSSSLENIDGFSGLNELREAYDFAVANQEVVDTKASMLPLLYNISRINYSTLDQNNKKVTVSALVIYPLLRKINKVMLVNHGTHLGLAMIPTSLTSVEAIAAATGALCILPDYIGVGASSNHPDLYLNAEVHGRTSTDALFALLSYAKQKKLSLASKYDTYILGYSQGGSVSLATLRTIQTLSAKQQAQLRLKKVICGDGPYDLLCTFKSFVADEQAGKNMGLGSVIPLVINSMFNSYPAEMAKYNYNDFFTSWALSTGVPQAVRKNEENLYQMLIKLNNVKLSKILNMKYIENNPEAYDKLLELMGRQNLCTGWKPQYPLQFFHCDPDGIVSYQNFVNAYGGLKNSYVLKPETPSSSSMGGAALLEHIYGMTVMMTNLLLGKYY